MRQHVQLIFIPVLIAVTFNQLAAQSAHTLRRSGDLMYDQEEYVEAEEAFRRANSKELTPEGLYNLGNAIYQQQRYDEAVKQYEAAAAQATDPALKAGAYYNLGNTHFNAQQLEESIDAYKNALKIDPQDLDTKNNLTRALQQLQQQQQQQQQQNDQEQQNQEQQQQQQQQQQSPQQEDQETEGAEQEQPKDLSKEEAEELLRIIDAEDQRVQEKLRKSSGDKKKPKKDW